MSLHFNSFLFTFFLAAIYFGGKCNSMSTYGKCCHAGTIDVAFNIDVSMLGDLEENENFTKLLISAFTETFPRSSSIQIGVSNYKFAENGSVLCQGLPLPLQFIENQTQFERKINNLNFTCTTSTTAGSGGSNDYDSLIFNSSSSRWNSSFKFSVHARANFSSNRVSIWVYELNSTFNSQKTFVLQEDVYTNITIKLLGIMQNRTIATEEATCTPAFATCTNTINSFSCSCNSNISGNGLSCCDIDECESNSCDVNATCTNFIGSYSCQCKAGFQSGNGTTCIDIDECESNPCDVNATCRNFIGSYSCQCKAGFQSGNGTTCIDIDECESNPCDVNATCKNVIGSYLCQCKTGFQSRNGTTCYDINDCESNPCGVNATCKNVQNSQFSIGSYSCQCKAGYQHINEATCYDIDECESNPCDTNGSCFNTFGSYVCLCTIGFTGNGSSCSALEGCPLQRYYNYTSCNSSSSLFLSLECRNASMILDENPALVISSFPFPYAKSQDLLEGKSPNTTINESLCLIIGMQQLSFFVISINNSDIIGNDDTMILYQFLRNGPLAFDSDSNDSISLSVAGVVSCDESRKDGNTNCYEKYILCNESLKRGKFYGVLTVSYDERCDTLNFAQYYAGFAFNSQLIPESCQLTSYNISGINLTFNATLPRIRTYSNEKCDNGIPRASILCDDLTDAGFRFVNQTLFISDCNDTSISNIVSEVNFDNISTQQLDAVLAQIDLTISIADEESDENINQIVLFLDELSQNIEKIEVKETTFSQVLSITNHVTNIVQQNPAQQRASEDIAQSVVTVATHVSLANRVNGSISFTTSNIVAEISDRLKNESVVYEPKIYSNNAGETIQPISLFVPSQALLAASYMKANVSTVRVVNLVYRASTLFPSSETADWVVSVNLNNERISNLSQLLEMQFNSSAIKETNVDKPSNILKEMYINKTCVFWNYTTSSWSTEGCCLVEGSNPPRCKCNHLTNFAVLLAVYSVPRNVALEKATLVGTILSIICLSVTVFMLLISKKIRQRCPMMITSHICINLILVYIIFLSGIEPRDDVNVCITTAVFLHYFLLTTWMWMATFAHFLYKSFIKIFAVNRDNYIVRASIISYGVPAVIVALNTAISLSLSTDPTTSPICGQEKRRSQPVSAMLAPNLCWLHGYSLYFSFALPVLMILIFNFIIFVLVSIKLTCKRKKISSSKSSEQTLAQQFSIVLTFAGSLGIVWLIGYFMLISPDPVYLTVMNWLFCFAVALQGFGIFLLFCVRNPDIRSLWWNKILVLNRITQVNRKKFSNTGISTDLSTVPQSSQAQKISSTNL